MPQRLAMRLIRLYPRAWRERYQSEMVDLVEQDDFAWSDAFDIARGAARERARAVWHVLIDENYPLPGFIAAGGPPLASLVAGASAVATMPAARWCQANGWTPSGTSWWLILLFLAPSLRGATVLIPVLTRTVPKHRQEVVDAIAVRRLELVVWIIFVSAVSVLRDTNRSGFQVFWDAALPTQMLGCALRDVLRRRWANQAAAEEQRRSLRTAYRSERER